MDNNKKNRFFMYVYSIMLRSFLYVFLAAISLLKVLRKSKRSKRKRLEILVTGTFYSNHWLETHLRPLALSNEVAVVRMVATRKVPNLPKVEALYPPAWLMKFAGDVPSRLMTFVYYGIRMRPDVVVGFHLLLNGLVAILLAKFLAIRSVYICGGGPREVMGGGYSTENRIFNKLRAPDRNIEAQLLSAVSSADLVVSMGTGAVEYFKSHGVNTQFEIVPGGFDANVFSPGDVDPEYDFILIGRLSEVKRVDIFLQAIKALEDRYPNIRAVVVGDGPDRKELEALARTLGIAEAVFFAGWQSDVAGWIKRSKVFVLTSESEGLSQALIQAMMCSLPAIVTDVGDLSDLVEENRNGFLVNELSPNKFANLFFEILEDEEQLGRLSRNAYEAAKKYHVEIVCGHWDDILSSL